MIIKSLMFIAPFFAASAKKVLATVHSYCIIDVNVLLLIITSFNDNNYKTNNDNTNY